MRETPTILPETETLKLLHVCASGAVHQTRADPLSHAGCDPQVAVGWQQENPACGEQTPQIPHEFIAHLTGALRYAAQ